eukprot:Platyproteum_vivax@DN1722_c0_g1_i2.p1
MAPKFKLDFRRVLENYHLDKDKHFFYYRELGDQSRTESSDVKLAKLQKEYKKRLKRQKMFQPKFVGFGMALCIMVIACVPFALVNYFTISDEVRVREVYREMIATGMVEMEDTNPKPPTI